MSESGKAHRLAKVLIEKDLIQKLRLLTSASASGLEPHNFLYLVLLEQDVQFEKEHSEVVHQQPRKKGKG